MNNNGRGSGLILIILLLVALLIAWFVMTQMGGLGFGHTNTLREPYSKHLEDGIFELRTKLASDITRALYFFYDGSRIVITHGFVKKLEKTPPAEILRAKEYRADWLRRNAK